jgi:hypothetical protein
VVEVAEVSELSNDAAIDLTDFRPGSSTVEGCDEATESRLAESASVCELGWSVRVWVELPFC